MFFSESIFCLKRVLIRLYGVMCPPCIRCVQGDTVQLLLKLVLVFTLVAACGISLLTSFFQPRGMC